MNHRMLFRAVTIIVLLFFQAPQLQAQTTYKNFEIKVLSEGVFAAIHTHGGHAIGNAGIVDLGASVLVFDCFLTPDAAAELQAAAIALTGKEVRYVVNSHYHNDHMRGNQVFVGSDIIASSKTNELMKTLAPQELQNDLVEAPNRLSDLKKKEVASLGKHEQHEHAGMLAYYEGIVNSADKIRLTYPSITFQSKLQLRGSKRTIELIDMGEGHTPSDVVMWLPEEKILFAGDLVFIQHQPWMSDGNPLNWLQILKRLADLQPETIVPGHGPVGDVSSLAPLESYIRTVIAAAERLSAEPNASEAIQKLKCPPPYDSWMLSGFYLPNVSILSNKLKK